MSSIGSVGGFRGPPPKPPSFETRDGNSDGALSLEEFKTGAPSTADSSKTEALFKAMDSDSSGSVSKEEQDAFKTQADTARQQLESFLFGLQSGGTESAGTTGSDEDDLFGEIDADSSGGVSKEEFLKAFSSDASSASEDSETDDLLSKLFDAIDANADGAMSKDEQQAFQKEAQDRGRDRGPPPGPPPSSLALGAAQAYGSGSQLGSQSQQLVSGYAKAA